MAAGHVQKEGEPMTMTPELAAFLEALEQTPRDWRLLENGALRNSQKGCPYAVVPDPTRWFDSRYEIWDAADNAPGHNPELRRALLLACASPGKV
jgi:hypothetical protein